MSKKTRAWLIKQGREPGMHDKHGAEEYYGEGNVKQCPYCESWISARFRVCNFCHIDYPEDGVAKFKV